MTTNEYIELFLISKTQAMTNQADVETAISVAQLISGSFVYPLLEKTTQSEIETDVIAQHLEDLYDSSNFHGIIYFIILLADSIGFVLPKDFYVISLKNDLIPILASAVVEDWLDVLD